MPRLVDVKQRRYLTMLQQKNYRLKNMEMKKNILSDKYSNISAETSKDTVDVSRRASEITTGIGGVNDVFETAKEAPFQSKLAPHSVVQTNQTFTEQVVNNAAKAILEAARRNSSGKETATVNATAAQLAVVSAAVSSIPSVGPIIAAILAAIAAMTQADGSQNKSKAADEHKATPGWRALKKDHDD